MCGIAGLVRKDQCPERIVNMASAMSHRGPDGAGVWRSDGDSISLGHQRLAIVDLSETGEQPMVLPDAGLALVYNGELYNLSQLRETLQKAGVSFRGHSDTEVLLQSYERWGSDCLKRVSGMFAFGIVDKRNDELVLARDPCGQKPLYYAKFSDGFAFASEVKAFHHLEMDFSEIDPRGLEEYLAYGYTLGPRTLTHGVRKLGPGEVLRLSLNDLSITTETYWTLPERGGQDEFVEDEIWLKRRFTELLEDSVRRHLVADVPVGVLLSGGIDSSLVAAMAVRVNPNIRTFTVSFPGFERFDESAYARRVAEYFGLEHLELDVEGFKPDLLTELAVQFDDPVADHAIVPTYLLAKRVKKEVAVALGGDGGDELFAGYPHYRWMRWQQQLRSLPEQIRNTAATVGRWLPIGTPGRNHVIGTRGPVDTAIAHVNLYFDSSWRSRLVRGLASERPEVRKANLAVGKSNLMDKVMVTDFRTTLAEGYLTKVDRASMLPSLELRAPFLDEAMVRFARKKVPETLKCRDGQGKILPRKVAANLLPEGIATKRKQGFTMPLGRWISNEWGSFFRDILLDSSQNILSHEAIRRLFRWHDRGCDNSNRIFCLTMLALWSDAYDMTLP